MGKLINTALVFIGGMTAGGYCVVNATLKSETFTTALKDTITKKTTEVLYGTECTRPKRKVSYYDVYCRPNSANHSLEYCDDIIFNTREDADLVLVQMKDIVEKYGVVSLADVYDITKATTTSYVANKYGWKSVDDAKVVRCRDGYHIKFSKPEEIN